MQGISVVEKALLVFQFVGTFQRTLSRPLTIIFEHRQPINCGNIIIVVLLRYGHGDAVHAVRQVCMNLRIDCVGDRLDGAIAHDELATANMGAAELF